MANKQTSEVILLDRHEINNDDNGQFMTVHALGGNTYKISANRQELWGTVKQANKGEPVWLIFETFKPLGEKREVKFVADVKLVTMEDILKAGLQSTLHRLLTAQDDERNRSQAVSYAKDLRASGVVKSKEAMFEEATEIFAFIKGIKEEVAKNGCNQRKC